MRNQKRVFYSEAQLKTSEKNDIARFVFKLLGMIFLISIVLGIFAFKNYRTFEKQMLTAQQELRDAGSHLSFKQCVKEVIQRVTKCSMTVLCIQGVPQLMGACLETGEHLTECQQAQSEFSDSHFGFQQCIEDGYTGKLKKICGSSYRTFADFCKSKYFQGK